MKFEKGKHYRTRDGRKAVVHETNVESPHPIWGGVYSGGNGFQPAMWDVHGFRVDKGNPHGDDLVGEYDAKPRRMLAWKNGIGMIGLLPEGESPDALSFAVRCPWLDEPEEKTKGEKHEHKN